VVDNPLLPETAVSYFANYQRATAATFRSLTKTVIDSDSPSVHNKCHGDSQLPRGRLPTRRIVTDSRCHLARADHILVQRFGYTHHGIDVGDGTVIHYTGEVGQKANAAIRRTPLGEFANGSACRTREYGRCDDPEVVIARAISRLGETEYHLVFKNCEHFATWCKTSIEKSDQVKNAATVGGGTIASGATVAAGIGAVSATGAVAGLSAAGIMSGLASVGGVAGGTAVAGIAIVGAVPTAMTSAAMLHLLKDDEILHGVEREARRAGRYITMAVCVGGPVASVGAVAATGTSGLSAAGITSGLAAVGSLIGGGMTAGVFVAAAAPPVLAAAAGYGSYRLWKVWRRGREALAPPD
jgi:hypothetical protein